MQHSRYEEFDETSSKYAGNRFINRINNNENEKEINFPHLVSEFIKTKAMKIIYDENKVNWILFLRRTIRCKCLIGSKKLFDFIDDRFLFFFFFNTNNRR